MNTDAYLRNLLGAEEIRHAAMMKAETDYSTSIKQILDRAMNALAGMKASKEEKQPRAND